MPPEDWVQGKRVACESLNMGRRGGGGCERERQRQTKTGRHRQA